MLKNSGELLGGRGSIRTPLGSSQRSPRPHSCGEGACCPSPRTPASSWPSEVRPPFLAIWSWTPNKKKPGHCLAFNQCIYNDNKYSSIILILFNKFNGITRHKRGIFRAGKGPLNECCCHLHNLQLVLANSQQIETTEPAGCFTDPFCRWAVSWSYAWRPAKLLCCIRSITSSLVRSMR